MGGWDFVLLDVDTLEPGDRWRCKINLWLGACDAAVVLLSETALESPYVLYETSVLAYRGAVLDPDLLIIPILLGNVTPEALTRSLMSPSQLHERQDLLWEVDHLRRLQDAQTGNLRPDLHSYVRPDVLWWAFHRDSALWQATMTAGEAACGRHWRSTSPTTISANSTRASA